MSITFGPASKSATKARIALCGPSGSGKTYTALALATALGDKVAVLDTERGSASKYVGLNGWSFDTATPTSFSPLSLVDALGVAAGAGYDVVVIDSWSHYWSGVDGMLEQVDRRSRGSGNSSGWKEVGPEERRMIAALVSYPGHVIVTLRVKTAYVVEEQERNGRKTSVPKKVGLKPEQREGIEYEFDLVGDLDLDNTLTVSKSRIPTLTKQTIPEPGAELAEAISGWLSDGDPRMSVGDYRAKALDDGVTYEGMRSLYADLEADQMLGAPTTDADGNPTVLGDLIVACGRAAKEKADA